MTTSSSMSPTESVAVGSAVLDAAERQLKAAAVASGAFGLLFSLGSHPATDWTVRFMGDLLFLRPGDRTTELADINHLSDAILGGVMIGWMVLVWMLADRLLHRAPGEVKSILVASMLGWFVVDSTGSVASGAWINVAANLAFLAMFYLPLRKI